jgi:hypothetical protein
MPTSRYEGYALPEKDITKEEVVGEQRIQKLLGKNALEDELEIHEFSTDS